MEIKNSGTKEPATASSTIGESTIGEIVARDMRTADVFKKHGIDFCCGGKKTLSSACKQKNLSILQIEKELKQAESAALSPSQEFSNWDLDFLADYIINTHHKYVAREIPLITEYIAKVAKVHGDSNPESIQIAASFAKIANELTAHMFKEEHVLFPYIKQIAAAKKEGTRLSGSPFGGIQNPIDRMEAEHEEVGNESEIIEVLTNNFMPPEGACTTFKLSYSKLKEFITDLHQHIHLEKNILFPKAVELETELIMNNQQQ